MTLALVYDTETTGIPDFGARSHAEHQPHIVQLAAELVDLDTHATVSSIDLTVRPDGWTIPAETIAIHGITEKRAFATGVTESFAVHALLALWWLAERRVGHVENFDARILRIALMRHASAELADRWRDGAAECTARLAAPRIHIAEDERTEKQRSRAAAGRPLLTLTETYERLIGEPMRFAHTARGDVAATKAIYLLLRGGKQPAAEKHEVERVPAAPPATINRIRQSNAGASPCPACGLEPCTCRRRT